VSQKQRNSATDGQGAQKQKKPTGNPAALEAAKRAKEALDKLQEAEPVRKQRQIRMICGCGDPQCPQGPFNRRYEVPEGES
jgi:hypothetical protein